MIENLRITEQGFEKYIIVAAINQRRFKKQQSNHFIESKSWAIRGSCSVFDEKVSKNKVR